jgi:hypothetical protein
MKRHIITLTALFAVAGLAYGQSTPTANPRLWGKTSIPALTRVIDANFALVDAFIDSLGDGTADLSVTNLVVGGDAEITGDLTVTGSITGFSGETVNNATLTGTTTIGSLSGILKGTAGVVSAAVAGTDYAAATSGTAILKGNNAGGFAAATAGTDYLAPGLTFTNSVTATITNLVIVVEKGLVTSITINDQTTPGGE